MEKNKVSWIKIFLPLLLVFVGLFCYLSYIALQEKWQETNLLEPSMYEFYEFADPNINMKYNIHVYEQDENYYATIDIQGFQTELKIKTTVIPDKNQIKLIHQEYLIGDGKFEQGDVLLKLSEDDSKIVTKWEKLKPLLKENSKNLHCFERLQE